MIWQLAINGLIAGSIYALVALGFTIIYGTVRFFHFAHGAVYVAGAYLAWLAVDQLGMPVIHAVVSACLLAGVIGILIDLAIYRPLRAQKSPNLVFLIASFGIFIFIQNLLQLLFGAQILTLRSGPVSEGYHILSAVITPIQLLILAASIITFLILHLLMNKTKIGKAMTAVADDPLGASVSGINSEKVILYAFGIGSALAGMAGVLVSLETNIDPNMGMNAIMKGIIGAIIGGVGSLPGAMLGGLFLGIVENLGIWKIQSGWKDTIAFAVLIIFLLFRPEGILGKSYDRDRL